jgi:tetratricopeptide (TPR) repeat protein
MKRVSTAVIILVAAGAVGCQFFARFTKHRRNDAYAAEPFYKKYLVPGNALDDRITEEERRVEAQPDDANLRNDFGNLLAQRRFVEDARMQYEKAIALDDSHFLAAYNLGLLWESEGKFSKAVSAYRTSISRKPGFPASHFRLGRLYEQRGWDGLAVKEYAKAFRLDPQMRDPRHNPLVVDTRLLERASLVNYPRDIAVAAMNEDQAYADEARFREVPVDRALSTSDVEDPSAPEPIDATVSAPVTPKAPATIPLRPGQTRPQGGQSVPQGAQPLPPGTLPPGTPPILPAGAPPPPPAPTPTP